MISEAYSVLTDPKKRSTYDKYGDTDFDNGMNHQRDFEFGFPKGGRGFGSDSSFGSFTFERAEEIFRQAFGEDFESFGFGRQKAR